METHSNKPIQTAIKMDPESRKKLDVRVKVLIENHVQTNHRSLFVIVGKNSKYQVCFEFAETHNKLE